MKAPLLALALAGCAAGREWVDVPGTELRIELVRVGDVWMAARETTWAEFDAFYEHPEEEEVDGTTRPSSGKNYLGLSGLPPEAMEPRRPVTGLRRHAALMYCEWLSKKTGQVFRLPSEREWAAGDVGGDAGWHAGNSGGRVHDVGERPPNARGLYDLRGNAREHVQEGLLLGGGWTAPEAERRLEVPDEWTDADPNRPASLWWFRTDFAQGFRVVRSPGLLGPAEGIEVRILSSEELRLGRRLVRRVRGELVNRRDRALEEVGLKVYYLTPAGRPHLTDATGELTRRATFEVVYPLQSPLPPNASTSFEADVPLTLDPPERVREDAFGAAVLSARFAE